ncbi:hypothetical protein V2I01_31680 [Micromonospora sp. BRA006-A]|nr:hypothetical protein [Micromonospora sp. BRA006-A]
MHDDGAATTTGSPHAGYGLRGMAERAACSAAPFGPDLPRGGWSVDASLPRAALTS